MTRQLDILVLGANYGLLAAVRLCLANHRVTVVCREGERAALSDRGATVRLQRRDGAEGRTLHVPAAQGRAGMPGTLGLVSPRIAPDGFDLVFAAMGEPQYADPEIAALMAAIADADLPVISLMNLLPPCFLSRLQTLDMEALMPAYSAWNVWRRFDPRRITAASPDAQAVRPAADRPDVLNVTLASNLKVAPFHDPADQDLLRIIEASVVRLHPDDLPAPARIVAHASLTVPLSKWPMLITGNCRCLLPDGRVIPISAAVRDNMEDSRRVYDLVAQVVLAAGAPETDIVPFALYASAARHLTCPSSLARALSAGARTVERVDLMILHAARSLGVPCADIAIVSECVQAALDRNHSAASEPPNRT